MSFTLPKRRLSGNLSKPGRDDASTLVTEIESRRVVGYVVPVWSANMDEPRRIQRARTFDEIAELYDRARPYYREELFDDLFRLSGIAPETARILEIGSGTGRATEPLARRGCEVVCIELGSNLARIATEKLAQFPRVTVIT